MSLAFSRKNENNIKFTCTQQYKKGSDEAHVLYFPHSTISSIVAMYYRTRNWQQTSSALRFNPTGDYSLAFKLSQFLYKP